MRDSTPNVARMQSQEVHSDTITTNVYSQTVELVKYSTVDLQLATEDYVKKETQKLQSDIT